MSEFEIEKPASQNEIDDYYRDCKEKVDAGETVWVRRNFDAEHGEAYDLFSEGVHKGFILHDGDYNVWEVHAENIDIEDETPQPFKTREEAEQALFASAE